MDRPPPSNPYYGSTGVIPQDDPPPLYPDEPPAYENLSIRLTDGANKGMLV